MATDPWKHLLAENEMIVWQGEPSAQVRLEWRSPFEFIFFLFFTGFSVFWMVMASQAGGVFWMFGLLFFATGSYNLIGVHFWKAYVRKHQHYTLTSQRAFIGTALFGRKTLTSYPIVDATALSLEANGATSNIYFAEKQTSNNNGSTVTRIGFEQIVNAEIVLGFMREIQQDLVKEDAPNA